MYKQVVEAKGAEITVQLPSELAGKRLEVTVNELQPDAKDREKLLQEAHTFFRSIAVDMSNFKFNRDEANER